MSKTSIFSSKYEKRRKRKRFLRNLAIGSAVLLLIAFAVYKPLMHKVEQVRQRIAEEKYLKENPSVVPTVPVAEEKPEVIVPESYKVTLPSGREAEVFYELTDGSFSFLPVDDAEFWSGDVSPSKKLAVVFDRETQEMVLVDETGIQTDITYRVYRNSKGYTESKESIMARIDGFVWSEEPRFLSENQVVFMSMLPWFKAAERYMYLYDITGKTHRSFQSIKGSEVVFGELSDKGLMVTMDGKVSYLTPELKVVRE
ncbi:hypothetical protein [Youngiibacter fragilis]|uniref:Uncharacterized protein n=1 Tax=Youngiibacter fragilis 232.1 TaxID=994573 RepID=V7I0Q1_9CLOT|nr:hypothetical protein [Youngiibacter fragilis]ETA79815.1 hypothetical protein T472_0214925 [Youngiibacter fragilis 232.1]